MSRPTVGEGAQRALAIGGGVHAGSAGLSLLSLRSASAAWADVRHSVDLRHVPLRRSSKPEIHCRRTGRLDFPLVLAMALERTPSSRFRRNGLFRTGVFIGPRWLLHVCEVFLDGA